MTDVLIKFMEMDWEYPKKGVSQKIYIKGNQQLRLLRFDEHFKEDDWCKKGHIGYVLDGEMYIDFNGILKTYKKGDGLWIEEGTDQKHCVFIKKNKYVELILFETRI
jgi:quercetin dioxygenase-like cupin family protein